MDPNPLVSIFIVNYNTRDLLLKCLESVFETKGDSAVEIFVADNCSNDGSVEAVAAKFPEVSVSRYSKNVGFTRAINPLLPLAKGRYNLLLHPDVELLSETLGAFLNFFEEHPEAGILGGNLYYPDGTPNPCEIIFPSFKNDLLSLAWRVFKKLPYGEFLLGGFNPIEWSHRSTSQVNWVWNACMIIRREVFEKVGYFDEQFFVWYADWDLCQRASNIGWSVHYLYPAKAIHHERHSFQKENITSAELLYKVDGWHSAALQMEDRKTFLKKHTSLPSIWGAKSVYVLENALRFLLVLGNLGIRGVTFNEASFQMRACLNTIRTILKA